MDSTLSSSKGGTDRTSPAKSRLKELPSSDVSYAIKPSGYQGSGNKVEERSIALGLHSHEASGYIGERKHVLG